jgi:hypothetical protein
LDVLGAIILFLGLFPFAVDLGIEGVGLAQIMTWLVGLTLLVLGAYVVVFALVHRDRPRTLLRDIGVRLGMTGLVMSAAAALADIMGFGSHGMGTSFLFGWVQVVGMLVGFVVAAIGVLIYGLAGSYEHN